MRQYFCLRPRSVEAGSGAARVILREEEVTVGFGTFYFGFEGSYLGGGSD
jgi:hypothetical protein